MLIKKGLSKTIRNQITDGVSYTGKYWGQSFTFNIYHNGEMFDFNVQTDFDSPSIDERHKEIIKAYCIAREQEYLRNANN